MSCEKMILQATINPVVSFAMEQNGISIIKSLSIINDSDREVVEIVVTVQADPAFCRELVLTIDSIPPHSTYQLDNVDLALSPTFLRDIPEKMLGQIHCTATSATGGETRFSQQIEVLSYDQWPGIRYSPELLTAFVLPNHPSVDTLTKSYPMFCCAIPGTVQCRCTKAAAGNVFWQSQAPYSPRFVSWVFSIAILLRTLRHWGRRFVCLIASWSNGWPPVST